MSSKQSTCEHQGVKRELLDVVRRFASQSNLMHQGDPLEHPAIVRYARNAACESPIIESKWKKWASGSLRKVVSIDTHLAVLQTAGWLGISITILKSTDPQATIPVAFVGRAIDNHDGGAGSDQLYLQVVDPSSNSVVMQIGSSVDNPATVSVGNIQIHQTSCGK